MGHVRLLVDRCCDFTFCSRWEPPKVSGTLFLDASFDCFFSTLVSLAKESSLASPLLDLDELEEARKERDEIRRMIRKENERERRREVAGKNRTKEERDNDRDISEKNCHEGRFV